jgi:hypothetical protein
MITANENAKIDLKMFRFNMIVLLPFQFHLPQQFELDINAKANFASAAP